MGNESRAGTDIVLKAIASDDFQGKLRTSLPRTVDQARFTRVAITALQQNPDILKADRNSLYLAILSCAQCGLQPDGKEAALVRYGDKIQMMPMIYGIIMRLSQCGITCDTQVVYERDTFEMEYGDDPKIVHKPCKLGSERGEMVGAYAILRTKDGVTYREVMDSKQIEAVRNQSRAKNSLMWTQFQGEAWRKTVLRRCAKRIAIPLDDLAERAIEADNNTFNLSQETFTPIEDQSVVAEQVAPTQSDATTTQTEKPASTVQARPRGLQEVLEHRGKASEIF